MLRQLRTLYNVGTIGDLTDGQLLEHFATNAGEVAELAFAALVERHEAMVWRACLAIIRNEHEAEDAFQATFLVLVHKARSLWVRDTLGPWLHQVACRTAFCLRRSANRRRRHERRSAEADAARSHEFATPRDTDRDAAIHEEVNRLPEKYRAPLILCDLEGRDAPGGPALLPWLADRYGQEPTVAGPWTTSRPTEGSRTGPCRRGGRRRVIEAVCRRGNAEADFPDHCQRRDAAVGSSLDGF